ncbi:hypothetical protein [Pedobacter jejuensis]|uniref:Uncharacterized protein n=1 Tax=Pedobacter jejuensis TaxID=1268550 RepID=A0A3N0BRZ3_9SPHI|nr:hypothetical protein [Pedobacter jejuensis]RNL51812.1 hypothetical protein D7004_13785 [Pedobacter jejuensis]
MVVGQSSGKLILDSIGVGDALEDDKGKKGIVFKIDILKYRTFAQYYFKLSDGKGTIEILMRGQ